MAEEKRKFTEEDIGPEDTIIAIEKDENGDKVVHIYGYGYYSESREDDPKTYRFVEYTFFYAALKDVLEKGLGEIENTQSEFIKQYIEDCSYEEVIDIYRHYDDGKCPIPIAEEDITEDIEEGTYAVINELSKVSFPNNAVDSCDADSFLADAAESHVSAGGMRDDGTAEYILDIWKKSSDRKGIEAMFEFFTNMEFKKFLDSQNIQIEDVHDAKRYIVVNSNNIDGTAWLSKPFVSKPEAVAFVKERGKELVKEFEGRFEGRVVKKSISEDSYCVILSNEDCYYGKIEEVEV